MEVPELSEKSNYEKVKEACTFLLKQGGKLNERETLSSRELFEAVQEHESFGSVFKDFQKNTFYQYLSNAVRDVNSSINCLGKRQGYYISTVAQATVEEAQSDEVSGHSLEAIGGRSEEIPQRNIQRESRLYQILASWLVVQGYQAQDVSSGRALGKWGNPDVAGIHALDTFNNLSVEVVTIEAKINLNGWEQLIFEAVSHRRFANRAYFAFAHPEETISKIPQDMRYYAELYGIGVLALSMPIDKYNELQRGHSTEDLDSEDVEVVEVFSAPFSFVQPKYQLKFCSALGVSCLKDLYLWGKNQE